MALVDGEHFRKECFGCDVLLVWPRYSAKQDSDTIEVVYVFQLAKNASVQIWFKVKYTFTAILYFDIDTIVRHWFNSFHIPIHGNLTAV